MVEFRKPIFVETAVSKVMQHALQKQSELVSIQECDDRRLADPIIATNPVPSFDKSPYDGFAIRAEDTENASRENPAAFEVVDHIGAGELPKKALHKNEATRIMTGAQIPDGATCVVMFEVCQTYEKDGRCYMQLKRKIPAGENIMKAGSEVKEGQLLVKEGTRINPGVKAVLATFGYDKVRVAKKPIVGIISTGTELLEVHASIAAGKDSKFKCIYDRSASPQGRGEYRYYGQLPDQLEPSFHKIKTVLDEVDILITTGGVSVGDYDLMPLIYEKLGAEVLFNKVAMRPGSVTTVAALGNQLLFGLSGNPSACYVGFELFTRPILQAALYNNKPYLKRTKAVMADNFSKANPFTRFVRSYITYDEGRLSVHTAGIDKSNVVTSLAHATCLMVLPGGSKGYEAGSVVDVLLLEDLEGQASFDAFKKARKGKG
ncbi:molybdopterin molybdotransferase MoeA [Virgibacillus sp. 179-BFC.A HS]|uniref:Molybdopterin molybdenumtransferase n=1 Tax=Tigheibacillus jepli TaxID=3035914 RepID=A0ABU5CI64_9BACI|nr:gephyrin-like molybdotransferase Glp [Virgibacillus sp. 179-BFC.A HS]MDY0406042.1 molybdopterin molybdotransferase MoeA [Virgibacillus sp. 179-BFC.A HS]